MRLQQTFAITACLEKTSNPLGKYSSSSKYEMLFTISALAS
jgi:hypothetical protein